MADNPDDGKKPVRKISDEASTDGPESFYLEADSRVARQHDIMGKITPLNEEELARLSTIELPEEEYQVLPDFVEYLRSSEELMNLIQSMCAIAKYDEERQEDDDRLDEIVDEICEKFILTLREMHKYCATRDDFLAFATNFIREQTNERVKMLQDAFGDEGEVFPFAKLKRTIKQVAARASYADSDEELPDKVGQYFIKMLKEDVESVRRVVKDVYRDQDIQEIKGQLARACEMLEQLTGTPPEDEVYGDEKTSEQE